MWVRLDSACFIFGCTTVYTLHVEIVDLEIPSRILAFWEALQTHDEYLKAFWLNM